MYYKFNGFTQRLVGAGASAAYAPQGLKPIAPVESPALIFGTPAKTSSEAARPAEHWSKNRVPELQKLFQKPDGVPVHLKRGFPDQLLYRTTMALTIGGAIYCLVAFYMMAVPKKER